MLNCGIDLEMWVESKILRFNDSTIQRFNDSTIQRFNDSTIQRFNDSTIQRFRFAVLRFASNHDSMSRPPERIRRLAEK